MEIHGEVEIQLHLNCSHCLLKDCQWHAELWLAKCMCPEGMELAADITCMDLPTLPGPLVLLVIVVVPSTLSLLMVCGVLILDSLSPYYCQAGFGWAWPWPLPPGLTEVSPANVTLLRALGHGAFGEAYEGLVIGLPGDPGPLQVAVKVREVELLEQLLELQSTHSPEVSGGAQEPSSSPDPARTLLDFLGEVLIISKFSHQNTVRCVGLSLRTAPCLILLELVSGGGMQSFLRNSRPHLEHCCQELPSEQYWAQLSGQDWGLWGGKRYLQSQLLWQGGLGSGAGQVDAPRGLLGGLFTSQTDSGTIS